MIIAMALVLFFIFHIYILYLYYLHFLLCYILNNLIFDIKCYNIIDNNNCIKIEAMKHNRKNAKSNKNKQNDKQNGTSFRQLIS